MSKLYVLVGLPGSGKSTLAEELANKYDAMTISSDDIRKELNGDVNNQEKNSDVFEIMNKRTQQVLLNGKNAIYDATNINRKRRVHLIKNVIKADEYHVIYINSRIGNCVYHDTKRDRIVGFEVIDKMYKAMQIPTILEGWNSVEIVNKGIKNDEIDKSNFEMILECNNISHNDLFKTLIEVVSSDFKSIYNLAQDSTYHSFSVSRHTYYVYKYILENYKGNKMKEMKVASLFHDIGKSYTKSFYNFKGEEKRYASFISHELVSSQIACSVLSELGYEDKFIKYVVDLIQFHMIPHNMSVKQEKKLKSLLTDEQYNDLMFLNEADIQAK